MGVYVLSSLSQDLQEVGYFGLSLEICYGMILASLFVIMQSALPNLVELKTQS